MNFFAKKRILFISPRFFNYEVSIKEKLEELGASVLFYDERPNNKTSTKVILRLFSKGLNQTVNKYYNQILEETKNQEFDFLFLLKGECTPSIFLENFKEQNPKAQLVFYSYDSLKNNANAQFNFKYFDKVFSFDKKDVEKHSILKFRPLFFLDEYAQKKEKIIYDISFIGTVHSDRYKVVSDILDNLEQSSTGLTKFIYFYCQSIWVYRFRKLFDKDFRQVNFADLSFKSLNINEVTRVFAESKCIIDIQHPHQTGLTMRTIEAIGARKKLITTNSEIEKYDFFDSRNILIVNRKFPIIPSDFLLNDYVDVDPDIFNQYSLKCWLEEVFGFDK